MDNISCEIENFKITSKSDPRLFNCWSDELTESFSGLPKNSSVKMLTGEAQKIKNDPKAFNPAYENVDITYTFDSRGFRIYPDLDQERPKKLFCFGCSYTFGHGLPDYETWPYMLSKKLGDDWCVKNYGVHGASFELISMLFYEVMKSEAQRPDYVCFIFPDPFRRFYVGNNRIQAQRINLYSVRQDMTYLKYKETMQNKKYQEHFLHTSIVHSFYKSVKCFSLIKKVANNYGVNWRWHTWSPFFWQLPVGCIDTYFDSTTTKMCPVGLQPIPKTTDRSCRDRSHWGRITNENISSMFLNLHRK